jgi:thiol-disulfide isomerase/thioredoxin
MCVSSASSSTAPRCSPMSGSAHCGRTQGLDYTLQRPVSTLGKRAWIDERKNDRDLVMASLSQRYGVFYFYASSCGACDIFSPILKAVSDKYGLSVLAVSMDGGPSATFPGYMVDSGQYERSALAPTAKCLRSSCSIQRDQAAHADRLRDPQPGRDHGPRLPANAGQAAGATTDAPRSCLFAQNLHRFAAASRRGCSAPCSPSIYSRRPVPPRPGVEGEMQSFMSDMGVQETSLVLAPTKASRQATIRWGGLVALPQKNIQPFNIQLPHARAGCGGIDLFAGLVLIHQHRRTRRDAQSNCEQRAWLRLQARHRHDLARDRQGHG